LWTSGQISLCHAAFAALGATSFSHLTDGLGLPWLVALLLAGLSTVPLGAVVALPAIRLSGVYLALATFGFGVLMQRMVYGTGLMFGVDGFRSAPRFDLPFLDGNSDRSLYYAVLALAVAASVLVVCIARSRLGRLLRGLAESPVALVTHGLDVNATRLLIFCLSAFLAGMGGALFVSLSGQISGDGFGPLNSLLWVAVLAIYGRSLLGSPLLAGAAVAVAPAYAPDGFGEYQTLLFGAVAIAAAIVASRSFDWRSGSARQRPERSPVRERTHARLGVQRPTSTTATLAAAGRR
jgi:ABC-type branched-subunit amino acid transport system permease subunit